MAIETERLLLRTPAEADFVELQRMHADPLMHRYLGGPATAEDEYWRGARERWAAHHREHGFGLWATVRKDDGRLLGRVGLLSQEVDGERHVEVAYALSPEFWGRGYALEAARACRDWAFHTLDVPHLVSLILPANERSIRVAERNGMTFWKEADFKEYRVRVYRITRAEWQALATG
ncbi:MAG TPA: GNAT family N-acetyltransferase [Longimicrobium sp.]|nr:GNAT family N-acetyltransferase [Longimicrobium sp.]